MENVVAVFAVVCTGLIGRWRYGGSTVVSGSIVTVNSCELVSPVAVSVAVTVTVAVPLVPAGAESCNTPFWLRARSRCR